MSPLSTPHRKRIPLLLTHREHYVPIVYTTQKTYTTTTHPQGALCPHCLRHTENVYRYYSPTGSVMSTLAAALSATQLSHFMPQSARRKDSLKCDSSMALQQWW